MRGGFCALTCWAKIFGDEAAFESLMLLSVSTPYSCREPQYTHWFTWLDLGVVISQICHWCLVWGILMFVHISSEKSHKIQKVIPPICLQARLFKYGIFYIGVHICCLKTFALTCRFSDLLNIGISYILGAGYPVSGLLCRQSSILKFVMNEEI